MLENIMNDSWTRTPGLLLIPASGISVRWNGQIWHIWTTEGSISFNSLRPFEWNPSWRSVKGLFINKLSFCLKKYLTYSMSHTTCMLGPWLMMRPWSPGLADDNIRLLTIFFLLNQAANKTTKNKNAHAEYHQTWYIILRLVSYAVHDLSE